MKSHLQQRSSNLSSTQHRPSMFVMLNVWDSVVDEGVHFKLSEAVKELVGVEGRLYCSLDGILGRNVKRVQDGLKRVREAMETEGRSDAKDDFSTLDKKRKWIEVYVCVVCVCTVIAGFLVLFALCTLQSLM